MTKHDEEIKKAFDVLTSKKVHMNSFEYLGELWDELITDHFYCKHEECPYKDCMYHMYSNKPNYFLGEDIPFYMPRSNEEMKNCMNYMGI